MTKISVIIPTYNLSKYIKEAIDSVLSQTYKDYEIIVIDDGSSDNTREILRPYIDKGLIRYIFQENGGIGSARNAGIAASRGDLIAFLDADDMWLPRKLEMQVPVLCSDPQIGLAHADILKFSDKRKPFPSNRKKYSEERVKLHSGHVFEQVLCRDIFISCLTVVVRKTCFDEVGYFDESPELKGYDDFDMWLRVLHSYKAWYIHEPLALYRMRPDSFSRNTQHMKNAHDCAVNKILHLYNISDAVKKRSIEAMVKEWSPAHRSFLSDVKHGAKSIISKIVIQPWRQNVSNGGYIR